MNDIVNKVCILILRVYALAAIYSTTTNIDTNARQMAATRSLYAENPYVF